ncbi:MAG: DUF2752 domain-containing protein [bacterium]|nr:DUF2752 domain-containing protein [bacterium]
MTVTELIGFQTPKARLAAFGLIVSYLVFTTKFNINLLPSLSVYGRLGMNSPSIGLTRAFKFLLKGDLQAAWSMNWIIFIFIPIFVTIIIIDVHRLFQLSDTQAAKN